VAIAFAEEGSSKKKPGGTPKTEQWTGAFQFRIGSTGHDPLSWRLGSEPSTDKTDILLAPECASDRPYVKKHHARGSFWADT
jgi:hypothetical protein